MDRRRCWKVKRARITRNRSLKWGQKTDDSPFSEFCGEEPPWCLGDPEMLKNTHPHLFDITGSKDSRGYNMLCLRSRAKAPRLHGAAVNKEDRSKAVEIVRRCCARA